MKTIIYLVYLSNLLVFIFGNRCCRIGNRESPIYKLVKIDSRSTERVVARRQVTSLDKCKEFAVAKKALAFNYRESSSQNYQRPDRWTEANCQALECPEFSTFSSLTNDTRFSYYSIYRIHNLPANASVRCLPCVGVFYISEERKNYTSAQAACETLRGSLAHIVSEERTEGLGKLVQSIPTFVGLSNRDDERIWKNEFDEPLSCFDYRAWDTNEPVIPRGCVGLIRVQNPRLSSTWRVFPCSRKSPFVCEILPRFRSNTHRRPHTA